MHDVGDASGIGSDCEIILPLRWSVSVFLLENKNSWWAGLVEVALTCFSKILAVNEACLQLQRRQLIARVLRRGWSLEVIRVTAGRKGSAHYGETTWATTSQRSNKNPRGHNRNWTRGGFEWSNCLLVPSEKTERAKNRSGKAEAPGDMDW